MVRKVEGFGKAEGFDVEGYRRRLRILREIISGDNQSEFVKRLGVEFKRWNNYERGYPVPREVAFLLHKKFPGMSIEWIWFGTKDSLSPEFKARIALAEKLDTEQREAVAELEKARQKLNMHAERRKKTLHPARSRARE